ncbi:MAG: histidinol-phosphate transaminase [Clostridiales Family XIII bacterium]|nr:histidinol-phosphate transaminase [Clostridiales Family XIII bacterium]
MSKSLYRAELASFKPYVQGKPIEAVQREYGLTRIEKLASNENQYGPSPKALEAIQAELSGLNFYPESYPPELVQAMADYLGAGADQITLGNGGEGIIWQISMAFLNAGDEIIVSDPTFDVYKISAALLGGVTVKVPLKDRHYDIDGILGKLSPRTKLVYLCTPNNPTGHIATKPEIDRLLSRLPDDVILVLDEAYYEFAAASPEYPADSIALLKTRPNIIVLRSFSKIYGLAGLRFGYALSSPEIAVRLGMVRQTFAVNRLAHAAARGALEDTEYRDRVVKENSAALKRLNEYFDANGWACFPSYANFVFVDTGLDSRDVFEELQKRGVIVRPGHLWGWDTWLRVSTGTEEQMRFFTEKMDEVISALT